MHGTNDLLVINGVTIKILEHKIKEKETIQLSTRNKCSRQHTAKMYDN